MKRIDFWFTMGSTYTYLTVMRLGDIQQQSGIEFFYRPANIGKIMDEQNNIPFVGKPVKSAYMWRDLERRAEIYGMPARLPAPYPSENPRLASRIALIGMREGWGVEFVKAAYTCWFQDSLSMGGDENLRKSLGAVKQDPERLVGLANSGEIQAAMEAETDIARDLGIFGSPTFTVGGEVFWGDDRLEDAVIWAKRS